MSELKNPRYEMIAQDLARGESQLKACQAAGFTMRTRTPAHQICKRPEIQERVRELECEEEKMRARREQIRKDVVNQTPHSLIDDSYLILELQTNLQRARALGNIREANGCLKMIGMITGHFKKTSTQIGRPSKKQMEQEALAERQEDPPEETDRPPASIADLHALTKSLDDMSDEG